MKYKLSFSLFLLVSLTVFAQEDEQDSNPLQTTRQSFGDYRGLNMTVGFVNPKTRTEGSAYYYENWDSEAIIYLKEQGRYKVENANINLYDNTLETLYNDNNVFTFNTDELLQFAIDGKIFRPLVQDGELKLFELFFNKGITVYKHYSISYTKSSPNPMINRRTNKYMRSERFYVDINGSLEKLKLTNRAFSKLFATDALSADDIKAFIESKDLSLKEENQLKEILEFIAQQP
ncbi:hypothetical protein [Gilvibacter sediminis]|uniref:hypothetical protein n=1 Tax=Gilvibacter sediminis TaxID=379071 RepID=UPI00235010D0|nr:hypothetical protein [Gilvibacter sediminis]MDC7998312.1 hypothetical protein [Gilvibacter sediminis]